MIVRIAVEIAEKPSCRVQTTGGDASLSARFGVFIHLAPEGFFHAETEAHGRTTGTRWVTIGITLDKQGWVEIDDLLAAANRSGRKLTRPLLERVVGENDKQWFAVSSDGKRLHQPANVRLHLNFPHTMYWST